MFAKIFLVCLISAVAFQGTQAKHIETFSMSGDLQDTVKELVHLYQEYIEAAREHFANFFENFVKLFDTLENSVTVDTEKLVEGMKMLIEKLHGVAKDIATAAVDCFKGESGNAQAAFEQFKTQVVKIFTEAKNSELELFEEAKNTNCVKSVQEACQCKEGVFKCLPKYTAAYKNCEADLKDKTFHHLVEEAIEVVTESVKFVREAFVELEKAAGTSATTALECTKNAIYA